MIKIVYDDITTKCIGNFWTYFTLHPKQQISYVPTYNETSRILMFETKSSNFQPKLMRLNHIFSN